jgi:hypothetical protein
MRLAALLTACSILPLQTLAGTTVTGTDGTRTIGKLPCAAKDGEILQDCHFEALPKEDGTLTLRIALPGGAVRYLYAAGGKITGTDSTADMGSSRREKKTVVLIPPGERYEIDNRLLDGVALEP